jgi:hypothetical protein
MDSGATCPELRQDGDKLHIGNDIVDIKDQSGTVEEIFIKHTRASLSVVYKTEKYASFINAIIAAKDAKTIHYITLTNCDYIKPPDAPGTCCTILDGYCDVFSLVTDLLIMNIDGHYQIIKHLVAKKLLAGNTPVLLLCHARGVPLADVCWSVDGLVPIRCWMFSNFDIGQYLAKIDGISVEKITV